MLKHTYTHIPAVKVSQHIPSVSVPLRTCNQTGTAATHGNHTHQSLTLSLSLLFTTTDNTMAVTTVTISLISLSSNSSNDTTYACAVKTRMPSSSKYATVEQDGTSKPPDVSTGEITPIIMRNFEKGCCSYFTQKKIPVDKQVHKILSGLMDDHVSDWAEIEHDCLIALILAKFMMEFYKAYLPRNWEDCTCIQLLKMA